MPRLQLLVATMNLTDIIGLCDKMHIASDALIINQSDCVKYECLFYHGYKIECYTFAERGLSRSRNNALLRCTGEILCIADDDMVYTDTYREDIINEFQKHPEADALVFNVTALNDERSGKPIEKYHAECVNSRCLQFGKTIISSIGFITKDLRGQARDIQHRILTGFAKMRRFQVLCVEAIRSFARMSSDLMMATMQIMSA